MKTCLMSLSALLMTFALVGCGKSTTAPAVSPGGNPTTPDASTDPDAMPDLGDSESMPMDDENMDDEPLEPPVALPVPEAGSGEAGSTTN